MSFVAAVLSLCAASESLAAAPDFERSAARSRVAIRLVMSIVGFFCEAPHST